MGWQALVEHMNALSAADEIKPLSAAGNKELEPNLTSDVEGGVAE
jgi:hypothetical protein